jgi:RIP metalloprotease RseP
LSFGKDKAGTEWTLNRIPLGGFVRLQWEDPSDESEFLHPQSLINASLWKKIVILLWWVFINTVFALIAFTIAFWIGVKPITVIPDSALRETSRSYLIPSQSFLVEEGFIEKSAWVENKPVIVEQVLSNGIAWQAWLQVWDEITSLDDMDVLVGNLWKRLAILEWETFTLTYLRDWQSLTTELTCPSQWCLLGIALAWTEFDLPTIQFTGLSWIRAARREMIAQIDLTFGSLWKLWSSFVSFDGERIGESVNGLSGPVGIVKIGGDILSSGWWALYLAFAGMISLALAIFNILPIPALDGWRIVWVLTQAIGRFSPQSYFIIENYINFFFFVILMILGVYIMFKDLIQIWNVSIPFIG